MKIELKKLKIAEHLSEETTAFTADIYVDGKNVGYAKNSGHGGCTDYHSNPDAESRDLLKRAEDHCEGLPALELSTFTIPMNLEHFIDNLVHEELKRKDLVAVKKKIAKRQLTCIMWGNPDFTGNYTEVNFKRPLTDYATSPTNLAVLQNKINEYKASIPEGQVFWNTNFDALGIVL